MRFVLTIAVWAVILSAVGFLFSARSDIDRVQEVNGSTNTYPVTFELTTTFSVEEDPFALQIDDTASPFILTLDGEVILSKKQGIKDREMFITEKYELKPGRHELFIKANPSDTSLNNAVHIRVLQNGNPINENTYWFTPGQTVNAAHSFTLETKDNKDEH
ncbi:conserved hypothetical protein [Denitrovibrio acetiphilus DSM 12809]|uniref:Uncharacterized protein n=1 Tax=Denitrovibrio acetiphilus (strain DSM 12809 / NBRC 114555 / N2460) TaxID=522772 RepID=D4H2B4_DENA2|nr:hypothetical protein [Denitrovibrio acetiphilus]ADD68905.1 conserved hypothetical protein [Denitrovibrio acetiphilus DSM 12809]